MRENKKQNFKNLQVLNVKEMMQVKGGAVKPKKQKAQKKLDNTIF